MTASAPLDRYPLQGSNPDRSISDDLRYLWERISNTFNEQHEDGGSPVSANKPEYVRRLRDACIRSIAPNWDGDGARSVDISTYEYALQLISVLPSDLPVPEIYPETDGDIAFEWDLAPRNIFSISVGRDGTLTFAGLFGRRKLHGIEFLGDEVPAAIWISLGSLLDTR